MSRFIPRILLQERPSSSDLQFAAETLMLCNLKRNHMENIKAVMRCFEAIFSLKVNFVESELTGVGEVLLANFTKHFVL